MAITEKPAEDLVNVDRSFSNAWLVYVNGIEMPVMSVSVSYGVWQIPEAEITLIPDSTLQRLGAEDRLSVQIFYLDHWHDPKDKQFRLMFDGEIVAWSYVNVQRGRSISFTCVDYMQIFTQLFFFFMSNIDDIATGVAEQSAGVSIDGVQTAGMGALYPYSLFADGLLNPAAPSINAQSTAPAPNLPLITRPIDYVYNVVRSMIQNNVPNRSVPAANFFAPWARRTKFHRRFVALPYLEDSENPGIFPIIRAVQQDSAVAAIAQIAQNIGSKGSIWQVLQEIYKTLMMEVAMIPTAPAIISDYTTLQTRGPVVKNTKTEALKPIMLGSYFTKPELLFGLPPACNVIFPPMIRHFAYEENYITQPTRLFVNGEAWTTFLDPGASIQPGLRAIMRAATAVAHPEELNFALKNTIERPGENAQNILIYPEEFYKGPVVSRRQTPRWFNFLSASQLQTEGEEDPPNNPRELVTGDGARDIYRKYAAYEFHKERYQRRGGGMVLNFNPYVVPGFPCAVFDRRSTQVDIFGYIMTVRQTLSTRDATTQVSFSYGRTFSEMFDLLGRMFDMENAAIDQQGAEDGNATRGEIERVGALAMAPAEPLSEVRDVVQNFDRAEAFYRALFFREESPEAKAISEEQAAGTLNREPETAPTVSGVDTEFSQLSQIPKFLRRVVKDTDGATQVARDLKNKTASFQYYNIVDFVDAAGLRSGVRLIGIDGKTRADLKNIINKAKNSQASNSEITTLGTILDIDVSFLLQNNLSPINPTILDIRDAQLEALEERVNNLKIDSNLRGDIGIEPKRSAAALFESYEAAMQYGSRPICTLDEYLKFLGSDAQEVGRVEPLLSLGPNDPRTYPARYYKRVRQYSAGPPPTVPPGRQNITNTEFITTPDGMASIRTSEVGFSDTKDPQVDPLPPNFPDNRANWDTVILAYKINALERLAPKA